MRGSRRFPELLLAAAAILAPAGAAQSVSFDELEQLARRGDLAQALERARGEREPLQRAMLSTWVHYRARDWPQALAAARDGLALDPAQPWLLERSAAAALSLRDGPQAARFAAELERSAAAKPASPERERWIADARAHAEAAAELIALRDSAARAGSRARWVSLAVLAVCAAALVAFARPARR